MASLVQLWNEWEIQMLVLLSFMMQVFLFFSGGFRRHYTNTLFRLSIWLAYLGADMVAVYAIGFLSRHGNDTCHTFGGAYELVFLWAPFLLVHLGGQDTITAFSMEDNQLWLRHLLNLLVQVGLTSYVLWKSAVVHSQFVLPAIFLFGAGFIKYGERIWALKSGSPEAIISKGDKVKWLHHYSSRADLGGGDGDGLPYSKIVLSALECMRVIRSLFVGFINDSDLLDNLFYCSTMENRFKVLEIELGLMYDDLYTKKFVSWTRLGIILRCIAQISTMVAFILFLSIEKKRYGTTDVMITYVLFIGGFCLEICSVFIFISSPWTWVWLISRKCDRLALVAWRVFEIMQPKARLMWSNSICQYNFLDSYFSDKSRPMLIMKTIKLAGVQELWRKWWHIKRVTATLDIYKSIADGIASIGGVRNQTARSWKLCEKQSFATILGMQFEYAILALHLFTDLWLHHCGDMTANETCHVMMDTCEKLSNYMFYLLVNHPSMLPVHTGGITLVTTLLLPWLNHTIGTNTTSKELFLEGQQIIEFAKIFSISLDDLFHDAQAMESREAVLEEVRDMWVMLLCYSATKSRLEFHAKQLSKGGELITFVWLFVEHLFNGFATSRFELIGRPGQHGPYKINAFDLPA